MGLCDRALARWSDFRLQLERVFEPRVDSVAGRGFSWEVWKLRGLSGYGRMAMWRSFFFFLFLFVSADVVFYDKGLSWIEDGGLGNGADWYWGVAGSNEEDEQRLSWVLLCFVFPPLLDLL